MKKKLPAYFWPLLYGVLAVLWAFNSAADGGDFDVYLQAAGKLKTDANIYAPPFIRDLQYYYSVFFAVLLMPFSGHVFPAEFLWLLLTFGLYWRIGQLIGRYFKGEPLTPAKRRIWIVLSLFFALQFVIYEISLIQVTVFLLWAMLESLRLSEEGKPTLAGMLLGLAINIKIMPVILLGYFLYRGKFRTFAAAVATFIILLVLPGLFIGAEYNWFLLSEWWGIINPLNAEHVVESGNGPHSLTALIPVYLLPTTGDLPITRNFVSLSFPAVSLIINLARLALLSVALLFLRSKPFVGEPNPPKRFWEIAYFLLLIPLVMPHQQKYNFALVLPMITYLIRCFLSVPKRPGTAWALALFALATFFYSPLYGSDILGRYVFDLTQHFRLLTVATLLLIPVGLWGRPEDAC